MIKIRKAVKTDWQTIQNLCDVVFKDNGKFDDYFDDQWALSLVNEKLFKKACTSNKYLTRIVEEKEPIGFLIATEKKFEYRTSRTLEIVTLGIVDAYRSQGIGQKLVDELAVWGKQHGYTTVYVSAYFKNALGIAFYKKNGFEPIDMSLEKNL